MKRYHIIPILFWIVFSLLVMALSYGLGLKGFDDPGAGFTPFAAALLLLINSFYLLMSCLRKTDKAEPIVEDKKETKCLESESCRPIPVRLRLGIRETGICNYFLATFDSTVPLCRDKMEVRINDFRAHHLSNLYRILLPRRQISCRAPSAAGFDRVKWIH